MLGNVSLVRSFAISDWIGAPDLSADTIALEMIAVVPSCTAVIVGGVKTVEDLNLSRSRRIGAYAALALACAVPFWWRYLKPGAWRRDPKISAETKGQIKSRLNDYMSPGQRYEYMKWMGKYPFGQYSFMTAKADLQGARKQLDATHEGIPLIKETIIDYLAGMWSSKGESSKILCFEGLPGTGKTTLATSIADAMGCKFSVVNVANVSMQEFMGAQWGSGSPGLLGRALINAGTLNPVILVDELEKCSDDVMAFFLTLFDPAQNKKIKDKYLGFDMDFSRVTFVATVNDLAKLSAPLRNRMQIINFPPYSITERKKIARRMVIPQVMEQMNLDERLSARLDALVDVLAPKVMKMDGGMRAFKRCLVIAAEKYVRQTLELKDQYGEDCDVVDKIVSVTLEDVLRAVNPYLLSKTSSDIISVKPLLGVVNVLQAFDVGAGGMLKIEALKIPYGHGKLMIGSHHKDTYQEAQRGVFAYIKTIAHDYGVSGSIFKEHDFTLVDAPGDGAVYFYSGAWHGLAHVVALMSVLTGGRPVRQDFAVAGAIDIHGNVLPVDGYREKIICSEPAGVKNVILPAISKPTIESFKDSFPDVNIFYVNTVSEALDLMLVPAAGA